MSGPKMENIYPLQRRGRQPFRTEGRCDNHQIQRMGTYSEQILLAAYRLSDTGTSNPSSRERCSAQLPCRRGRRDAQVASFNPTPQVWLQPLSAQGTHQGQRLSATDRAKPPTMAGQGHRESFKRGEHLPGPGLVFIPGRDRQLQRAGTARRALSITQVCALRSPQDKAETPGAELRGEGNVSQPFVGMPMPPPQLTAGPLPIW